MSVPSAATVVSAYMIGSHDTAEHIEIYRRLDAENLRKLLAPPRDDPWEGRSVFTGAGNDRRTWLDANSCHLGHSSADPLGNQVPARIAQLRRRHETEVARSAWSYRLPRCS